MDKVKKFETYRKTCISDINVIFSLAQRAKTDKSVRTLLKVRCTELDNIKDEFLKHHTSLVNTLLPEATASLDDQDTIREGFLAEFYFIKGIYTDLFESDVINTTSIGLNSTMHSTGGSHSHVQLPKIELTKFSGDYKSFPSYLDLFNALVHNNPALSAIEKFNYLISSLQAAPLSLVRTLSLTAANYPIAYDTLTARYSNVRLRAQALWTELDNAPKAISENVGSLRKLLDVFSENIAALKLMNFPTDSWDFILLMMMLKRLDHAIVTQFELQHGSTATPSFKSLVDFLTKHCIALDTLSFSSSSFHSKRNSNVAYNNVTKSQSNNYSLPSRTSTFFVNNSASDNCLVCKGNHTIYRCHAFVAKSITDRYNFCRSSHLCFACLSSTHDVRACQSAYKCKKCSSKSHHTLLHTDKLTPSSTVPKEDTSKHNDNTNTNSHCSTAGPVISAMASTSCLVEHENKTVLLSTAWVDILDHQGHFQSFRCLLDSGSMTSFITQKAVHKLGLQKTNFNIEVRGLSSMTSCLSKGKVTLSMKPVGKISPSFIFDGIILEKICDELPSFKFPSDSWSHIDNIHLADRNFNSPGKVDLLLGADLFSKILLNGKISGNLNEPDAINTCLGYILMGQVNISSPSISAFLIQRSEPVKLEETMKSFWEVEEVPSSNQLSADDEIVENHFKLTHARNEIGRYTVSLPFREPNPSFPGIRELALMRFYSLERRLLKQPHVYTQYREFMREYLDQNHMQVIPDNEILSDSYYIPHHCVLKPDSLTTKLRVVFDASAKLPNQKSLNECLFTGPKLQQDIFSILLRFRCHLFALCSDVKQMYRMISIDPNHKKFQRIVWRFSPDEPISDYTLCTVVYGISSSPFLALRVLLQLAQDEGESFPLASECIKNSSYVDDFVCGASTYEEARTLVHELIELMKRGAFELRKWSSNEPSLLADLPVSHLSTNPLSFDTHQETTSLKILGLQWNPSEDAFFFSVHPSAIKSCTKRTMLSELAKIYDPLGFLTPITFFTKYLIQRLWVSGIGWDEGPSQDIVRVWNQYNIELPCISTLRIERKLLLKGINSYELHGFCDASEKGYACVIYVRSIDHNNQMNIQFVCGKSKVAPVKKITIPRLELCAAVLLAKLLSVSLYIFKDKIQFEKTCAWSDSQIVLHWIKSSPHRFKTFVSNRVAYIQSKLPPESWYYVESKHNPSDVASRGILPSDLSQESSWFRGSEILQNFKTPWMEEKAYSFRSSLPLEEERKITLFLNPKNEALVDSLLNNFSSLTTLQRVMAYILRFVFNCQNPLKKRKGPLLTSELNDSLSPIIQRTQQISFADELRSESFSKPLKKLHVFMDSKNLLRVGGRLENCQLRYDTKYPILLPRNSRLTTLIIEYFHKKHLHAGNRTTQFLISQRFWILSPKRAINSILSKCYRCWKVNPRNFQPPMGNLPQSRISQLKPFSHVGVDYGGPFTLTMTRHRGVRTCKGYLCLFVCFATKALHLELASDLSAPIFLAALQRFMARRGRVSNLYSDNGTNFVGASRELAEFMKKAAERENISHTFIPPASPHFGGLWESGIKSVKTHLHRVIGQQILTYEEFNTVIILIESVLNSRPLVPLSNDVEDINALTPNHFLTLEPVSVLPLPDFTSLKMNRVSRWQMLQKLQQDFWKRWHLEYLHTLQQRGKWLEPTSPSPEVGTLVLIKEDNCPPCKWVLGRIAELHPGRDTIIRVATVKTPTGTLRRPLVKLCPLPSSESDSS